MTSHLLSPSHLGRLFSDHVSMLVRNYICFSKFFLQNQHLMPMSHKLQRRIAEQLMLLGIYVEDLIQAHWVSTQIRRMVMRDLTQHSPLMSRCPRAGVGNMHLRSLKPGVRYPVKECGGVWQTNDCFTKLL